MRHAMRDLRSFIDDDFIRVAALPQHIAESLWLSDRPSLIDARLRLACADGTSALPALTRLDFFQRHDATLAHGRILRRLSHVR